MTKKKLRVWTLFSWIWAPEHALDRLWIEHEIVFACDIDKYCKQTFFANHNIIEDNWYDDVRQLDAKKYKWNLDLLIWWSPCQSFSMVWKRKWLEDLRGNLVFEFIRVVKESKPEIFIFENVKWMLSHEKWKTWSEIILPAFEKLNYSLSYQVLNWRDYWIPQNRERVYLVWKKNKKAKFFFPAPIQLEIKMQDLLEDNPDSKYFLPPKGIIFVSDEKNLKKRYTQINGDIAVCQKANQQFNWHWDFVTQLPKEKVEDKYFLSEKVQTYVLSTGTKEFYSKPKTDLEIARPLLSSMAKMHRAWVDNYITRWEKLRKLTPRECFRLMWFTDSFKIIVSDTQAYKQAWNSMIVNVLMSVFTSLNLQEYGWDN